MADETHLEQLVEQVVAPTRVEGVVIGVLVGFADDGAALVDFPGNPDDHPVPARCTIVLSPDDRARAVALLFEEGDPFRPILIGPIVHPALGDGKPVVERDGERIELTADREIVLRCGQASITLTRAGKVLIRGAYVSSRSSGVNRIKGGSVQIN
jgi:hypothetical protein